MTKSKNPIVATPKFIIQVAVNPVRYVSSPTDTVTTVLGMAACWDDEGLANSFARTVGGTVMLYPAGGGKPTLSLVPTTLPRLTTEELTEVTAPTSVPQKKAKAKVAAITTEAIKAPRGVSRELVVALLAKSGLPLVQKSSDHYGDPKGSRLVLPKAAAVTRIYLYKTEDSSLLGYKTAEERKAEKLGAVTHVADITDIAQVEALITAVMTANGLTAAAPKKRKAKKTPAAGIETVTTTTEAE